MSRKDNYFESSAARYYNTHGQDKASCGRWHNYIHGKVGVEMNKPTKVGLSRNNQHPRRDCLRGDNCLSCAFESVSLNED